MSKLDGHWAITQQAVKEVGVTCANHLIAENLSLANLPLHVVMRDLLDLTSGHWADFGQKHHFMRRFDGQSPKEAYEESVKWIQSNALMSARILARRINWYTKVKGYKNKQIASHARVKSCGLPNMEVSFSPGLITMDGGFLGQSDNWQPFGNALHALQDSFAHGHAVRVKSMKESQPGAIEYIKIYAGDEVKGHSEYDKLWEGEEPGEFSLDGRLAINASKQLIILIVKSAQSGLDRPNIMALIDWESFKGKWLVTSNKLSNTRDFAIDLIEEFHTGLRRGYTNWVTINFDEKGLAEALITRVGDNASQVYSIFKRLDKGWYLTDIDDIALIYVTKIQKKPHIANSIRNHPELVSLLVKSMDEGWTTDAEKACIKFLKEKK